MIRTALPKKNKRRPRNGKVVAIVAIIAMVIGAVVWHDRIYSLIAGKPIVHLVPLFSDGPVTPHPDLIRPGYRISSRDLAYLAKWAERSLADNPRGQKQALTNLKKLADEARSRFPQVIWYQVEREGDRIKLIPQDWNPSPHITRRTHADIVIVGGELSSLCTAVEAAENGLSVAVVYAGPLGGLSSDEGGNLRFFDVMKSTSHPIGQKKIWRALKVIGYCAIPTGINEKLRQFVTDEYEGKIELIQTESYDSLVADFDSREVDALITTEGVEITGSRYIDMDPESRFAEKCAIPMNTDTQHLSYGLVFTIDGIQERDWLRLDNAAFVTPEKIAAFAGVSLQVAIDDPQVRHSYERLKKFVANNRLIHGKQYSFGYPALAQGFDFYMQCRGIVRSDDRALQWVNKHRSASGFNIAMFPDQTVFNSISYKLEPSILQHSHSLKKDGEFQPIRKYDVPSLERYFKWVSGNPNLTIHMPDQFYVRSASAFFETLHPYEKSEFNQPARTAFHTYYPMDLRDLSQRDPYSWPIVMSYVKKAKYSHFWDARPSATYTRLENLFLVNKSAVTPVFFGGQRIEGSQINMGAALIHSFKKSSSD
jgi:hypothetical protein